MAKVAIGHVFIEDGRVPAQTNGHSLQNNEFTKKGRSRGNVSERTEVEPDGVAAVEIIKPFKSKMDIAWATTCDDDDDDGDETRGESRPFGLGGQN
eukprot:scaffold117683_cov46-Cyclotella_meneghiniana.AAC.2